MRYISLLFLVVSLSYSQEPVDFIPTKWEYKYVPIAERTRKGGWQSEWSWSGFWKQYWLSYRFKTGIEVEFYANNPEGGMTYVGSAKHWFPSEDCDDIDYDVKNCTSTIRDNLNINTGTFLGEEHKELTYDGYHSETHVIWDATSTFYNRVKTQDLKDSVKHLIPGYISQFTDNYVEVNTKCTDCSGKSSETICGITPSDMGISLQGEYSGKESEIDYFFTCDVINEIGLNQVASTLQQIIDKSYLEPPEVPLPIDGDNYCLDFIEPPSPEFAGNRIDKRFNLVGGGSKEAALRTGLEYYTLEGNYENGATRPSSMPEPNKSLPPINHKVVREVGKLLQKNATSLGFGMSEEQFKKRVEEFYSSGLDYFGYFFGLDILGHEVDPFDDWYEPNIDKMLGIEGPLIDEIIALEKQNQVEGTIWEIGNEPNLHIRLNPEDYAALYVAYHKRIIGNDLPEKSRIALGALIITELLQESRSRFVELAIDEGRGNFNEKVETVAVVGHAVSAGAGAAVFYTTGANGLSFLLGVSTTAGLELLGHGITEYGRYTAKRMSRTAGHHVADAILNVSTAEYLEKVLLEISKIAPEILPQLDVVSLHAYRYEEEAPFIGSCQLEDEMTEVFDEVKKVFQKYTGKEVNIWVTEFGNISDPDQNTEKEIEELAEQRMNQMASFFSSREEVERWFWFKSIGADKALEQLKLTPFSRLFLNSPGVKEETPHHVPWFTFFDETTLSNLGENYLTKALVPGSEFINPTLGENPKSSETSELDDFDDREVGVGSFEKEWDWLVDQGTLEIVSWPRTEGDGAIKLPNNQNYTVIASSDVRPVTLYEIGERLALDVWLPKDPAQDYGNGQINMHIKSLEGNGPHLLNNDHVGHVMLDKLTQNNFNTVYFDVPSHVSNQLAQAQVAGIPIQIVLAISSPFDGIILDNLRFQDSDAENFDDRTPTGDILGFENIGNWSSPDNLEFNQSLTSTQGDKSLEINSTSMNAHSGNLWSDAFAADESGISIANFFNIDVLPNTNGEVQVSLHCPEHFIHNDWIGRQPLNTIPQGGWSRVSIEIPYHIRSNLNTFAPYCRIRFSFLNLDGSVLVDNVSFSVNSEESLAHTTNQIGNVSPSNSILVAKNQELNLPAGKHSLRMVSEANWAYESFKFNVSPRDGVEMDFSFNGKQVSGWIFEDKIDCKACTEVFVEIELPEDRSVMIQWWEEN